MLYWRKDSFEQLATLRERLVGHPELDQYIKYLHQLEQGLRRQALEHIQLLISALRGLDISRQRELASLLCREATRSPGHKLIPYPLRTQFIDPVLDDWIRAQPDAAEPLRWTNDLEDLNRAVKLDPFCDHTRWRLVTGILESLRFASHELPETYLGDLDADEGHLIFAGREAQKLGDDETRTQCLEWIREELEKLHVYKQKCAPEEPDGGQPQPQGPGAK